jgi:hypothetical protein
MSRYKQNVAVGSTESTVSEMVYFTTLQEVVGEHIVNECD